MANITIVKLKVRRGSDAQRKQITLDQGEVGYTLDTRRLFVGDGSTLGGRVIGNTSIGPFSDITNLSPANSPGLQVGDIGYANSKLYRLTSFSYDGALSGYAYIGNLPDERTITFGTEVGVDENKLTVKKLPGALNAEHFSPSFFGQGLLSAGDALQLKLDTRYLFLSGEGSSKVIAPVAGSITEREIFRDALGFGLSGGTLREADEVGAKLSVNVDPSQFDFDSGNNFRLRLKSLGFGADQATIPLSSWAGAGGTNLNGLEISTDNKLQAAVRGVEDVTVRGNRIELNDAGELYIAGTSFPGPPGTSAGTGNEWIYPTVENGLVTGLDTSIFDIVTGIGLSGQNVGDNIPIGAIIPHARTFPTAPAGYLLCNGGSYSKVDGSPYKALWDVISDHYGSVDTDHFNVPALTGGGMPGFLYGAAGAAPEISTPTDGIWLSGGINSIGTAVSGLGVNYIIKYKEDPLLGIFNGSPDQINEGIVGQQNNQIYECIDSAGANVQLSSGGFIRFALSGTTRSGTGTYNRFAIPVFNYE